VRWQRVATAEFDAATGALTTGAQVLQDGFQATGAGADIAFIGYAPTDLPSAPSRVAAVLSALAPVAQPKTGAPQGLSSPPAGYVDVRDDGSIFLIAMPVQQKITPVLQVVGFDRIQQSPQTGELFKLLLLDTPHRQQLAAAIGPVVREFGTVDLLDDTPDDNEVQQIEQALADSTTNVDAVDRFPVLWIDRDWLNAEPQQGQTVIALADRIAGDAAQRGPLPAQVRQVIGALGTDPTPAVLIEVYQTRLG
jgi:hypothetical protein